MVQWLGCHASTAGGHSSIPGWGAKILQVARGLKKKKVRFRSIAFLVSIRHPSCTVGWGKGYVSQGKSRD